MAGGGFHETYGLQSSQGGTPTYRGSIMWPLLLHCPVLYCFPMWLCDVNMPPPTHYEAYSPYRLSCSHAVTLRGFSRVMGHFLDILILCGFYSAPKRSSLLPKWFVLPIYIYIYIFLVDYLLKRSETFERTYKSYLRFILASDMDPFLSIYCKSNIRPLIFNVCAKLF